MRDSRGRTAHAVDAADGRDRRTRAFDRRRRRPARDRIRAPHRAAAARGRRSVLRRHTAAERETPAPRAGVRGGRRRRHAAARAHRRRQCRSVRVSRDAARRQIRGRYRPRRRGARRRGARAHARRDRQRRAHAVHRRLRGGAHVARRSAHRRHSDHLALGQRRRRRRPNARAMPASTIISSSRSPSPNSIARVDALARRRSAFHETADALAGADVRTWRLLAAAAERFVGITKPGARARRARRHHRAGDRRLVSRVHLRGRRDPPRERGAPPAGEARFRVGARTRISVHVAGDRSPIDRAIASGSRAFRSRHHARDRRVDGARPASRCDSGRAAIPVGGRRSRSPRETTRGAILVLGAETRPNILRRGHARARAARRAARRRRIAAAARIDPEPSVTSALQRALLPGVLPASKASRFPLPMRRRRAKIQVGGDWYDAMALPDGRVLLSIGDVAGHGLERRGRDVDVAARDPALRARRSDAEHDLATRERTDAARDCRVATALIAILEPLSLDVTLASAGHPPPADRSIRSGDITHLDVAGVVLGTSAGTAYADVDIPAAAGFVDAALHRRLDRCRRRRARGASRTRAARDACDAVDDLAGNVFRELFGDDAPHDDVALLAVTASATLDRLDLTLPAEPANAGRARTAISRFLNGAGMADRAGDLLVAAGEAIGNAIEHAYHGGSGAIRVRGRAAIDAVTVEIRDFGTVAFRHGDRRPRLRLAADARVRRRRRRGTHAVRNARRIYKRASRAASKNPRSAAAVSSGSSSIRKCPHGKPAPVKSVAQRSHTAGKCAERLPSAPAPQSASSGASMRFAGFAVGTIVVDVAACSRRDNLRTPRERRRAARTLCNTLASRRRRRPCDLRASCRSAARNTIPDRCRSAFPAAARAARETASDTRRTRAGNPSLPSSRASE